ncbi:hypothetical protein SUGI_0288200 [Cryptomeria japonica]|uniref:kinesin-like protein KIN-14K n=1 Tax=Cryptomeria japonica TaxID=3369 RepID=UPI002408A531|nr:kinesin-like protein KIN-14K [Cryptomeria japonica]GLJ16746.1 hypothetical protein SUGI_0288200 [Cryptomeria japonica]
MNGFEENYKIVSRAISFKALASRNAEKSKLLMDQLQKTTMEKNRIEEQRSAEEEAKIRFIKEFEESQAVIQGLKDELQVLKTTNSEVELELQKIRSEKMRVLEEKKTMEKDMIQIIKEKETAMENLYLELGTMKMIEKKLLQELELQKREVEAKLQKKIVDMESKQLKEKEENEIAIKNLNAQLEAMKKTEDNRNETQRRVMKQAMVSQSTIQTLKAETEFIKKTAHEQVQQLQLHVSDVEIELQKRFKETQEDLVQQKRKNNELEAISALQLENLRLIECCFQKFLSAQVPALNQIKFITRPSEDEISMLEQQLNVLASVATNYPQLVAENRLLYNEVQDLKGNIRVYCRVRPCEKQSTLEYTCENGELLISSPNKQNKESRKKFTFNKVFGPSATQEEVFRDTKPLVRSVLDGFNVCIFAYGQSGSGKTYTMTGSKENPGVNCRALTDLFEISENRKGSFKYSIGIQMIEIYNEQVHDLLAKHGSLKNLGIKSISQGNGVSVPDANMFHVDSREDALELIKMGEKKRSATTTALNESSSRSHSIVTVYVEGRDLSCGTLLRGCLHLIDLAGSERINKSEVSGDRRKEAVHINQSLSALGDVIQALATKSAHVPYRNSKLTQILQDSLGGQAKTLMFVQFNPDIESYSETMSTLKFAERVSTVELGAAHDNRQTIKEGRNDTRRKDVEPKCLEKENEKPTSANPPVESDRMRTSGRSNLPKSVKLIANSDDIHSEQSVDSKRYGVVRRKSMGSKLGLTTLSKDLM